MPIVPLHGHEALRARLADASARGVLPQSLLLHGAPGIGKQRLALWLAQSLLCEGAPAPCGFCRQCRYTHELVHPDLWWIFPRPKLKDGDASPEDVRQDLAEAVKERVAAHGLYAPPTGTDGIHVATTRLLVQVAAVTPAMARRKVVVVGDAERMAPPQENAEAPAANAFLKLLEEPPNDTYLILTSSAPGALLPTIRSRVVAMRVAPLPDGDLRGWLEEPPVAEALRAAGNRAPVEVLLGLAGGAPGRLLAAAESDAAQQAARRVLDAALAHDPARALRTALAQGASGARGAFTDTLDALIVVLHERVRAALGRGDARAARNAARAVATVEERKLLAGGNVNPQLVTAALLDDLAYLLDA